MNTDLLLDALTKAIEQALQGKAIMTVTKQGLSRGYQLSGSSGGRTSPYGRYQVHVVATRDTSKATVMYNDYGVKGKGASTSRVMTTLDSTGLADEIGQFLTTGQRGQ